MASVKPPGANKEAPAVDKKELNQGAKSEAADARSITSRQRTRDKMQADIDAFLAAGGQVQEVAIGMSAEKLN